MERAEAKTSLHILQSDAQIILHIWQSNQGLHCLHTEL